MNFELISFKLCPFVQRSVITLLYKNQPYQLTYIDLDQPPAWFKEIAPTGKVPLLKIGDQVLFESAVINEYINDVTPGNLMPSDALQRAQNRAWIEYSSQCLGQLNNLITAATEEDFHAAEDKAIATLGKVEQALGDGPYFNGNDFALIDASYAPLFMRYHLLAGIRPILTAERLPQLHQWMQTLMAMEVVKQSVVPEFPELYRQRIVRANGYAASLMAG